MEKTMALLKGIEKRLSQRNTYKRLMLILWLFLIFLLLKGFAYGKDNHMMFIPSIYKMANPNFLNGDWYISALVPYHYLFKSFYASLMHYIELPLLFFFSYCAALFLYIIGLKKLSHTLFKQDGPFYILFPLVLIWHTFGIEGNMLIHYNNFESLFLATPIAIFSITYFFEDKMMKCFVLAGLVTMIHLQIGINLFIILLSSHVILNFEDPLKMFKDTAVPVLSYLVISAWPLLITLQGMFDAHNIGYNHFYIDYARLRMPHHYILSTWKRAIFYFTPLCILGITSFMNKKREDIDKKSITFITVILIGILIQYIFIELIPIDLIAKFHFFRMSIFVSMFAFMYFANYLYKLLDKEKSFITLLLIIAVVFSQYALAAVILLSLTHLIRNKKIFIKKRLLLFLLLIFLAAGSVITFKYKALYTIYELYPALLSKFNLLIFAIIIGSSLYILSMRVKKMKPILYNASLIPLIALSILTLNMHAMNGFFYNINTHINPENGWERLCLWIKGNTSRANFFIIPPYRPGFHLYAERKGLVDFKSNPFFERDIVKWKKRLEDVLKVEDAFAIEQKGWQSPGLMKERYNSLSENDVRTLAKKYKADYIIFEKPKNLPFKTFYEDKYFIIYALNKNY